MIISIAIYLGRYNNNFVTLEYHSKNIFQFQFMFSI